MADPLPEQFGRLPVDGNGNPIPTGDHVTTGTVTSGTGTGTDDVTLPKGALEIHFWATGAFEFGGVGTSAGTYVTMLASAVHVAACAGTNGSWKAYFNTSDGSSVTINYMIVMGAK